MSKAIVGLIVTGTFCASAASLFAQSTPVPEHQERGTKRETISPLNTQALMQGNGGSLLQASEPAPTEDSSAKASSFNLFAVSDPEPHVLKKHDLVNIVVNEESKSQTSGESDQERAVDFDAKVDAFVKLNLAKFSVMGGAEGAKPPEVKLEGSRDFKGTGEYDRSDTMTTRLEAEVIDVKPNGTLVIQAKRHLKLDAEDISMTLTGNCRVQDVDASNSVLSTDLHDLDLQKTTTGQVHDTTKRGVLHRLLDLVNPF